ncbi:mitochondrial Homoaconitase [Serendipita sp. 396]|nr:mitochondrial Homoaconitase [Serendipita sp. 396]KAG8775244.1 mitochondrial Homoaconitase [Serendipita sp. 397]KAG8854825.1 mitochondrial Homoaconitase [Serendipita sp. 405]
MLAPRPYNGSSKILFRIQRFATVSNAKPPQTFIEKVVQRYALGLAPGQTVRAGDYVMIRPEHVMSHDNTGPVISKFKAIGASRIFNPKQAVFTLDHDVQNKTDKNLKKYATIEAFARSHEVDFYPAGRGIGHQILVEEGYAFPQTLTVASDSHSNMYGGVGCVGTPIVRTDAAAIWATGQTWWQVPRMIKVELSGKLSPGVTGKDVIVALCGLFNNDQVLNGAIEFTGDGISALDIDDRLTISNMTTEWGALAGVFPVDEKLLQWYESMLKKTELRTFSSPKIGSAPPPPEHPRLNRKRLNDLSAAVLTSDPDATYSSHLRLDLSTLVPHVSGPNSVKISTPLPDLTAKKIAINKAYLVSCTNSRASDLAAAAAVVRGHKIAPNIEFYVAAASSVVQRDAEVAGDWATLIGAGARTLPAGCGPCIGLGTGLLEEGEVGISATNRNYKGRMGNPKALAYLASPAVVAASAVKGYICGPDHLQDQSQFQSQVPGHSITSSSVASSNAARKEQAVISGFPKVFSGRLLFAPQDNLNTDGIYPGKYTYQDDMTLEQQAKVVMENYDPSFAPMVAGLTRDLSTPSANANSKRGVILVSGYNFGTGSSREQAATALKSAGVPLVISGSFGDIFKRNAINNALICMECPELVRDLTEAYTPQQKRGNGGLRGELTVNPGWDIEVEMATGSVVVTTDTGEKRAYSVQPVGPSVQELWTCNGLEGFVLQKLKSEAV